MKRAIRHFLLVAIAYCMVMSAAFPQRWVSLARSIKRSPNSLKILFVLDKFPCHYHTFILNQLKGLIDCGHEIHVLAEGREEGDIPGILEGCRLGDVFYKQPSRKNLSYDVIYCQFAHLLPRCLRLRNEGKIKGKLVVGLRGGDASLLIQKGAVYLRELFQEVDLFLPVCDYFHKKLLALSCPPEKSMVLHSPIDCKQFPFLTNRSMSGDMIRFITVCRLVEKKGVAYAIHAIEKLMRLDKNFEYWIVGDGPLYQELQNLINKLGMQQRIMLLGQKKHEEVVSLLAQSHVFVLPSCTTEKGLEEGIPNAPKEAMAMGLMCVCTRHSGTPELIQDGITGFLVDEHDSDALYAKLHKVLDNKPLWPLIAQCARQKIEDEYSLLKEILHLEAILKALVGKGDQESPLSGLSLA